jgi:hypothetical protein
MSAKPRYRRAFPALAIATLALTAVPVADEGMWTFDNLPRGELKKKYGFEPTTAWIDHIRLASVRFNDGGSGSFVIPRGLALTNHHVASGQLQKLSTPEKNYLRDGFYAKTPADELKCPDLELNVLVAMEDVTARIAGAATPAMTPADALEARKGVIAAVEKESLDKTGLRSDVVTLYNGGEYWLYRYKRYTDVRLVFAPEQQIAFFGGDPDNFTYPRYNLDFALVRAYENGKPVASEHYLTWNAAGADDGELVFVSGHPGSTDRQQPLAKLETLRDVQLPGTLEIIDRRLAALGAYGSQGAEQARQGHDLVFGLENARKALGGQLRGLKDPEVWSKKEREEREFRARVEANADWKREFGSAWDEFGAAETKARRYAADRYKGSVGSQLTSLALALVQSVEERTKPDAQRLEEFRDAQLPALELRLFSPAPVYPGLEETLLRSALELALEKLGPDEPYVKAALQGRTPADTAKDVIRGTKLGDVAVRKALVSGGPEAVRASTDPLVAFVRRIDPPIREARKRADTEIESVETLAGERMGKARFAAYGKSAYPDATFTLRLSYGAVKGYPMNGTQAPARTTFYGLYDRARSFGFKAPYDLPERYTSRQKALTLATPFNIVTTNDIIGGNSGSPVINRKGELVGLVFDGNIESLVGDFVYDDRLNRTVAVHSAAIVHTLRAIYDAAPLADEIEGRSARPATASR